jgi:hypothetical protein
MKPISSSQLRTGTRVESREHHVSKHCGEKIARDHLKEHSDYYTRLKRAGL